jgi:hypothetical protein
MKNFYLYIILLCIFILIVSYYNTYISEIYNQNQSEIQDKIVESFSQENNIILLGDSILNNEYYIKNGKSIAQILEETIGKNKVFLYARDNANINNSYNQISEIPLELNNSSNTIFLSIGGNDIIDLITTSQNHSTHSSILKTIFSYYKRFIKSLKARMNQTNLVLLDLYYPDNLKYKQYHSIISKWNQMIYNYASDSTNKIKGVIKISNLLRDKEDFTFNIEPSKTGGEKIAKSILDFV